MNLKIITLFFYKIISSIYIFIFGRKKTQFINNVIFSLSLNAKGYKNYGNFNKTGEKKFIKKISKDLKLCIDVGANIGNYTKLLISETNANVISFEPLTKAFEDLKNIESQYPERLKVFNCALGEKNEFLDLNYSNEKSEKASFTKDLDKLSFYDYEKNKIIKSELQTLDNFFKKNMDLFNLKKIDLIKIDTEGFELEVIKGAKELFEKIPPKYIQIEFNWHQMFKGQTLYNFSEYLKNYDLFQILPHGNDLIRVDPKRPETNIFHLSNFVYIRKDISIKF